MRRRKLTTRIDLPGDIEPERKKLIERNFKSDMGNEKVKTYCVHGLSAGVRRFVIVEIPQTDDDMIKLNDRLKHNMEMPIELVRQINEMHHKMKVVK